MNGDRGLSNFDVRHRFTGTLTYALPGRKGFGQMLEGWKMTSIVSISGAGPWGVAGSRGNDDFPVVVLDVRWLDHAALRFACGFTWK